jgi:hypothetical protein
MAAGLRWLRDCVVDGWPAEPTPQAGDVGVLA